MPKKQPKFVFPGFTFVHDKVTDTVETHMAIKNADGSVSWEITHTTTAQIFEAGAKEYMKCVEEIRRHHARKNIAALPRRRTRKVANG